ncbi:ammonium transporter [Fructobacillus durionis]|uniref:Ammonium transporter n=1 Tax=Fructobacillus durionis TaxID=283737 RepID=A0A1I1EFW2_9LACO|nr:ammonium transporter [Fructobacillus durionis]SFB86054.1 ammonium transporter (TC 1.A.11) [Fructobacillus durionis]
MSSGDIAFVLVSSLLVWLMTPGLALFYAGVAEEKNRFYMLRLGLIVIGLVSVLWFALGYSFAFPGTNHFNDIFKHLFLNGVSFDHTTRALTIPDAGFAFFQGTFAIITVMIITGSIVGRMKTAALLAFLSFWMVLVYAPLAHMVWDNGFIAQLGAIDFAGGTVVHISSGVTGLTLALVLGARRHMITPKGKDSFTFVGGLLLWLGWFGFNGGSALAANGQAISAIINTGVASATAMLVYAYIAYRKNKVVTVADLFNGSLAGLVVITPAAGFVAPWASLIFGILVAFVIHWSLSTLKTKCGYDDTLDAFGIHGVGGILGALLTGVFASKEFGSTTAGLIQGSWSLLGDQVLAVVITIAFTAIVSYIIAKILSFFFNGTLRVDAKTEEKGLN